MAHIQPVIMAGGTGSRLWPLSRELYPKQVLNLTEKKSLLQGTVRRLLDLQEVLSPLVIVGDEHRFMTKNQLDELELGEQPVIILEPVGRNTAPAVCAAVHYSRLREDSGDTVLLILPSDHLIRNTGAFKEAITRAVALAADGMLVTFGIKPSGPETGYGYIEKGEGHKVKSFVEKPDLATAEKYLAQGNFYWNSGMFAFSANTFVAEMEKYAPAICAAMQDSVTRGKPDGPFFRLDQAAMARSPDDSIDYALMEKSDKVAMVPVDLGWSDIGSWQALWEVSQKDGNGNVVLGDVMFEDAENSLLRSEHRLVAAIGVKDTLVVETADAVLVAPLNRSQDVKKIVARLKKDRNKDEHRLHRTVYRPWGSYTLFEEQPRFKIKRITVNPGAKLSLQMHHHRSEHWVVVSGTARVTRGEETFLLQENQSTYISAGEKHRLGNPGNIPLELIEVQNGSYLGEDDIVRFDDVYGREG